MHSLKRSRPDFHFTASYILHIIAFVTMKKKISNILQKIYTLNKTLGNTSAGFVFFKHYYHSQDLLHGTNENYGP